MDIAGAAGAAEKVIADVMKIEPMIATGISMLVPGAAPIVATVQPMIVMAAPFIERALDSITRQNGGDAFAALLDLLNHISPGRPNSTVLAPQFQSSSSGMPAQDASRQGSG